jgi:hypothetical protein
MNNHVHLLIETPKSPISKIMQVINFTYTNYFNRKHDKTGHLFQGRYKSYLCDKDSYLLSLISYIHNNPVRAKFVRNPIEYKWSSYHYYIGKYKGIIDTEKILRLFSESPTQAKKLFKNFVERGTGREKNESLYAAVRQQIIGDDQFIEKIERVVDSQLISLKKPPFKKILSKVSDALGVTSEQILSRSRNKKTVFARHVLTAICREAGYSLIELNPFFKRDISVLSRWSMVSEEEKGRRVINAIIKQLSN